MSKITIADRTHSDYKGNIIVYGYKNNQSSGTEIVPMVHLVTDNDDVCLHPSHAKELIFLLQLAINRVENQDLGDFIGEVNA